MAVNPEEWMKQGEYDMDSAEYMLAGKRNFHAVFFCHLAIEKALKGVIHKKSQEDPPKVHSLTYLRELAEIKAPPDIVVYLSKLNNLSVISRYPETLVKMEETMDNERAISIVNEGRKALRWILNEFNN
jgi:HEPN domain-containing protein